MKTPCTQTYHSIRLQEIKDMIGKMSIRQVAELIYQLEEVESAMQESLELMGDCQG